MSYKVGDILYSVHQDEILLVWRHTPKMYHMESKDGSISKFIYHIDIVEHMVKIGEL